MSTPADEAFNTTAHIDGDEWRAAQWTAPEIDDRPDPSDYEGMADA